MVEDADRVAHEAPAKADDAAYGAAFDAAMAAFPQRRVESARPAWERKNTRAGLTSAIAGAMGQCTKRFYCPGFSIERRETQASPPPWRRA